MFGFQTDGWLEASAVLSFSSLHTGLPRSFPGHCRQTQTLPQPHCPQHSRSLFATLLRESLAQRICHNLAFLSHLESEIANVFNSLDTDLLFLITSLMVKGKGRKVWQRLASCAHCHQKSVRLRTMELVRPQERSGRGSRKMSRSVPGSRAPQTPALSVGAPPTSSGSVPEVGVRWGLAISP